MGRRVLTVYELSFHEKRKRKPASFAPANLDGEDLLDVFQTWVEGLTTAETHNEDRQTWVSVADVLRYAPRVLLLDLRVGAYGEAGELVKKGENFIKRPRRKAGGIALHLCGYGRGRLIA